MSIISWDMKDNLKTSLSETQKDSIFELASSSDHRPFPKKFEALDGKDGSPEQESAGDSDQIQMAAQFYSWLGTIESKLAEEDEEDNKEFLRHLESQHSRCSDILSEVDQALSHLDHLSTQYTEVSTKTNALHEACEHLLGDQTALMEKAKCIEEAVRYFNNLDSILVKLSSPSLNVSTESFEPILKQVDESLRHIQRHPAYKESAQYQTRINQCLSKAMTLLKGHVIRSLDKAISQIMEQKETVNSDNTFTLLYGKFRAQGIKIRCIMELVEDRMGAHDEYDRTVQDVHTYYLFRREALLHPVVNRAISDLVAQFPKDHCALLRSGCALLVHLCEDEIQLSQQFFTCSVHGLNDLLERVCLSLYDAFRPLLIHIQHLETLAELCGILKVEMIEEHVTTNALDLSVFRDLCDTILADVQERLIYRSHVYIRSQILGFSPAPGDLAYPDKLEMMQSIAAGLKSSSPSGSAVMQEDTRSTDAGDIVVQVGHNMPLSPADLHGMWYPTVRRTLVCLSKLSRCLDSATFQGLSQDCLSKCVESLVAASAQISTHRSPIDAQLFLIKHLLILREQVAPFNIEFCVKETSLGFNKIRDAAIGLWSARRRLVTLDRTNALLAFLLETPDVIETVEDSRRRVDGQLKATCELLIEQTVARLAGRMQDFVTKVHTIQELNTTNKASSAPQVNLLDQPFASPEKVADVTSETYRSVNQGVPRLQNSLRLYLANQETERILFRPIRAGIQRLFRDLAGILEKFYSEEDRQIIACPSEEQLNLLLQMKS